MKTNLDGQVAIVTGAARGIGLAIARQFARDGYRVAMLDMDGAELKKVAQGAQMLPIECDVAEPTGVSAAVDQIVAHFGRIDALVNNAGYGQRGPLELVPLDAVRRNYETNLFSVIALTQLVIPVMRGQGSGRIVNVSSVAGRIVWPFSAVYGSTKHALEAISDGLRIELEPFGIQVVVIEPGFVRTEFTAVADAVSAQVTGIAGPYGSRVAGAGRRLNAALKLAAEPEDIAALIARALAVRRPRTRYAAPLHARAALLARRVLPQRLLDRLLTIGKR